MTNNLDALMDSLGKRYADIMDNDPLSNTPDDINVIIAYHRKNRANAEAGIKAKKETGPEVKIDLIALGMVKAPEPFKRRI